MNDWSRLAVDLHKKQKLRGRKQELHQYKYAPDKRRTGPRPVRKRELTNPTVGRRGEDNSVCPLTNTYHEWPVKWGYRKSTMFRKSGRSVWPALGRVTDP